MPANTPVVRRIATIAVALCAGATLWTVASARAPAPEIPDEWPDWLRASMQRDVEPRRARRLRIADAGLQTRLRGKLEGEPEALDVGWYFSVDFGATSAASCWLYTADQYLATTLGEMTPALLAEMARPYGTDGPDQQVLYFNDAGAYGDIPYFANEWLWVVEDDDGRKVGLLKMRAAKSQGVTFVCAHQETGFRDGFAAFFETLVREAEFEKAPRVPYYREILAMSAGGLPIGVARTDFYRDAEGDTQVVTDFSAMMPVDASTLAVSDSNEVEWSTPEGYLINGYSRTVENGEVTADLALNFREGWTVTGALQGKEVEYDLGSGDPLSTLGEMMAVRALVRSEQQQTPPLTLWIADADPASFLEAKFLLDSRDEDGITGRLVTGPLEIRGRFDQRGSMVEGRLDAGGGASVVFERIYVTGELAE